ncbi:MAG: ORF6N domain-containing protein [Candidatus Rifleibacteriota bacterium]
MTKDLIPANLETRIYTVRGQKVMLDSDLAELYQVETKALKRAVRRNIDRFPDDFMFELTKEEAEESRRQNGTLNSERGHNIKYLPYAFTEQGLAMLSGVLNSQIAVRVNIEIMRTFVKLRAIAAIHGEVNLRLSELERTVKTQGKSIDFILDLIDKELKKKKIGFKSK